MSRTTYIAKIKDTLELISCQQYGHARKANEIGLLNGLKNSDPLQSGQLLVLSDENNSKNRSSFSPNQEYTVNYGDSLSSIAANCLGSAGSWREITTLNCIRNLDCIFVGQQLQLPRHAKESKALSPASQHTFSENQPAQDRPATMFPARAFFFVIADEFNPLRGKYVRKVFPMENFNGSAELVEQILNPEKYGFSPIDPNSNVSIGRHVLGRTDSRFISASSARKGSPRFDFNGTSHSKPYWIDIEKLKKTGVKIYEAEDIVRDLDRIAAKSKDPRLLSSIEHFKKISVEVDKEILIEGDIPARLIRGSGSRAITRVVRVVGGIGIVLTVYDLGKAGYTSYEQHSVLPLTAQSVRQVGGWGSALAGFRIGMALGGAFGIETGPGAIFSAASGGLIFGTAGYFGSNWIAEHIYDEKE